MAEQLYDAILVVSFGGPEAREDVIPFLENVLRGRNVPRERMLAVAGTHYHFGGNRGSFARRFAGGSGGRQAQSSDCLHRTQHSAVNGEHKRLRPPVGRSK